MKRLCPNAKRLNAGNFGESKAKVGCTYLCVRVVHEL